MSLDVEKLLMRQGVFVRAARDAARRSVYFLDMLYPTHRKSYLEAIKDHWKPALHQIKGMIRGVYVPSVQRDARSRFAQLDAGTKEKLGTGVEAEVGRAEDLAKAWKQLQDRMKGDGPEENYPFEKIPELRRELAGFLRRSPATGLEKRVLHWLSKHVALFLAAALVAGVSLWVEAVNGLLRNEGLSILFYVVLLPLPFYIHVVRALLAWRHNGGYVHPWDIGGRPFWGWRPLAIAPGRLIERWPRGSRLLRKILRGQALKLAVYVVLSGLAVAVLYQVWKPSAPAVPLILWLFYGILLAANQLDFWDFLLPHPLRFLGLGLIFVALVGLRLGFGQMTFIVLFAAAAAILLAVYFLHRKRPRIVFGLTVTFAVLAVVNTCGHLTHAKRIWTEETMERDFVRLAEWPFPSADRAPVVVLAASGGGSRAAVYTALTLTRLHQDHPEVAARLQAIGSVSGGSLAQAAYVARRWRQDPLDDLVEAVSEDFLYPTILGALVPGRTRGESIEDAWQKGPVALKGLGLGDLAEGWRRARQNGDEDPPYPMPLFNTTTLEAHDVVLSPLEKKLYVQNALHEHALSDDWWYRDEADDPYTWVYYRAGIYGLEDFLRDGDLPLSSAVLASANFPFGFPVIKVRPYEEHPRPLFFSPERRKRPPVKLTDGGALSNSGMWSLFHLLRNNQDQLRERGVLLIVVEASKMPEYGSIGGTFNGLLGAIGDQAPIARNLHRRMLDVLERDYGDRLASVQIDLVPRESLNVMTTWALDRASLDKLRTSFEKRWPEVSTDIIRKWEHLRDGPRVEDLIDRRRPPLD